MPDALPPAGLLRRLLALVYDGLLLLGLLMVAVALLMLIKGGEIDARSIAFRLYLLAVCAAFFVGFWTHGGQTLGMKAWRIRVQRGDGRPLGRRQALARFALALVSAAALGLGFLWALIDRDRQTWHDRLSHSRVVDLR